MNEIAHPKKAAFLAAYAECASITKAAESAQVARRSHYEWMSTDADYAAAFAVAREQATDALEDEAVRRAKEGTQKPVYQGGQLVGYIQEYSDTLMIFLLKGNRPDKFKERNTTELTGKDGKPVDVNLTAVVSEYLGELRNRNRGTDQES